MATSRTRKSEPVQVSASNTGMRIDPSIRVPVSLTTCELLRASLPDRTTVADVFAARLRGVARANFDHNEVRDAAFEEGEMAIVKLGCISRLQCARSSEGPEISLIAVIDEIMAYARVAAIRAGVRRLVSERRERRRMDMLMPSPACIRESSRTAGFGAIDRQSLIGAYLKVARLAPESEAVLAWRHRGYGSAQVVADEFGLSRSALYAAARHLADFVRERSCMAAEPGGMSGLIAIGLSEHEAEAFVDAGLWLQERLGS